MLLRSQFYEPVSGAGYRNKVSPHDLLQRAHTSRRI